MYNEPVPAANAGHSRARSSCRTKGNAKSMTSKCYIAKYANYVVGMAKLGVDFDASCIITHAC